MISKTDKWRQSAHEVIAEIAQNNQYIVSDMVVTALEQANLGLTNYSSLGGVFTRAAKAGLIKKTDEKQQSTRSKSHSAKTVWVSLVYKAKEPVNIFTALVMAALDFNAITVRYASLVYSQSPLDKEQYQRAANEFMRMQTDYQNKISAIINDHTNATQGGPNE